MTQMPIKRYGLVFALFLSACSGLGVGPEQQSATSTASQESPSADTTASATSQSAGPITLTIWLPPQFDPAGGDLSSTMLLNRLNEFTEQHPQVLVDVRVKAEEGSGGLLDSLLGAYNAAPLALPDLVLMPSSLLPLAVDAEVLQTDEDFTSEMNSDDWYPFAKQMSDVNGNTYGVPFAADALVLAFRPTAVQNPPDNWDQTLAGRRILGLAAADPLAMFTFTQLRALEKTDEDDQGTFVISDDSLEDLFGFYEDSQKSGVLPVWLTQYQNPDQSWQAFSEGRMPIVVAWASRILANTTSDVNGAPLPTQDGEPFTLARGWLWTIATQNVERAALAAELTQFLTTPEFIAQWTAAAGLLPPRQSSLAAWSPDERQALASQIVGTAQAFPDQNILVAWGEPLSQALVALLKGDVNAAEAIQIIRVAEQAQ
jgi:ABC-type glycerol-3-phosphate transport system substrate-binding protein